MNVHQLLTPYTQLTPEKFFPKGWENPVYLRRMSISELFTYIETLKDKKPIESSSYTLCFCIVDENGAPTLDYSKEEDVKLVSALPPKLAMEIVSKFRDINALGETLAQAPAAAS